PGFLTRRRMGAFFMADPAGAAGKPNSSIVSPFLLASGECSRASSLVKIPPGCNGPATSMGCGVTHVSRRLRDRPDRIAGIAVSDRAGGPGQLPSIWRRGFDYLTKRSRDDHLLRIPGRAAVRAGAGSGTARAGR